MKMFLLGALIMYLLIGLFVLIANTFDIDEDIKDIVMGWWLIPIVIIDQKIRKFKSRK